MKNILTHKRQARADDSKKRSKNIDPAGKENMIGSRRKSRFPSLRNISKRAAISLRLKHDNNESRDDARGGRGSRGTENERVSEERIPSTVARKERSWGVAADDSTLSGRSQDDLNLDETHVKLENKQPHMEVDSFLNQKALYESISEPGNSVGEEAIPFEDNKEEYIRETKEHSNMKEEKLTEECPAVNQEQARLKMEDLTEAMLPCVRERSKDIFLSSDSDDVQEQPHVYETPSEDDLEFETSALVKEASTTTNQEANLFEDNKEEDNREAKEQSNMKAEKQAEECSMLLEEDNRDAKEHTNMKAEKLAKECSAVDKEQVQSETEVLTEAMLPCVKGSSKDMVSGPDSDDVQEQPHVDEIPLEDDLEIKTSALVKEAPATTKVYNMTENPLKEVCPFETRLNEGAPKAVSDSPAQEMCAARKMQVQSVIRLQPVLHNNDEKKQLEGLDIKEPKSKIYDDDSQQKGTSGRKDTTEKCLKSDDAPQTEITCSEWDCMGFAFLIGASSVAFLWSSRNPNYNAGLIAAAVAMSTFWILYQSQINSQKKENIKTEE